MDSEWEPYGPNAPTCSGISRISMKDVRIQGHIGDDLSFIGQVLMGRNLETLFYKNRILHKITNDKGEKEFQSINTVSAKKKYKITPEELSKLWRISLKTATRTLQATTHKCICTVGNLTRCFKTNKAHLRYKKLAMREGSFYVDTLFSKVKSIRGYTCGNLYTTTLGFKKFFPMKSKNGQACSNSLQSLIHLVGIPPSLFKESSVGSAGNLIYIRRPRNHIHHGKIERKVELGKLNHMPQR